MDGLKDSVVMFSENIEGATPKDVMDLLLLTQYFGTSSIKKKGKGIYERECGYLYSLLRVFVSDVLKDIGNNANTRAVFLPTVQGPTPPEGMTRDGMLQALSG